MARTTISAVLKAGTLAYWDTFAGLVPCRVRHVAATRGGSPGWAADITLTAARGPYRRGEIHDNLPVGHVIPRPCVRKLRSRSCSPYIIPYTIAIKEG